MADINMIRDPNGHSVQTLSPHARILIAIGSSSVSGQLPANSEVVRIAASGNCFILFGGSSVTVTSATGDLFPTGAEFFNVPVDATYIAVIREGTSSGNVTITRMK